MADDEEETMSEGFSASEDEWKPPKSAPGGGESSDDDDSEFEEVPAAAADKARKKEAKPRSGAKAVQGVVKKRKPATQSLRTKLYNKYRPPPKTLTSPSSGNNSPSASTSRMASKNATAPNEASEYRNDGSSSESSVDDYLVNPAELDLQSSFFQSGGQLAGGRQPSKSPEPVFDCNAGIKNLSDSDSEDNNESSTEDQKTPAANAFDFRGLLEKANSLERAKEAIAKREAERQRDNSAAGHAGAADDSINAAAMDVNSLLALGENAHRSNNIIMDHSNIPQQRLQKTKSTRIKKRQNRTRPNSTLVLSQAAGDESDDSDLEEVADDSTAATTSTAHDTTHSDVPTDLEIHVELPSRARARDRKQQDLEMAIRRKINRDLKERQLLLHKASLLCCFARSFNYNRIANSTALWQKAVQLLPSKNSYPSEQGTEQRYFQAFVTWFKTAIKLPNPNLYADDMRPDKKRRKAKCQKAKIIRGLLQQFVNKEACCKQDMVLMFVALVRGMGMQCRLVVNMTPLPMKPSQSDLLKVTMKPEAEKKASSSKDEKPSTSAAAQRSNSLDSAKDSKATVKAKPLKTSKSEEGGGDADEGKTSAQQKREQFATSKKSQQNSQEPPAKKPLQKKSSTEKAPEKEAPVAKGPAAKKPVPKRAPSKEPPPKEPPPKELPSKEPPKRLRNLPKNEKKPEASLKVSKESKVTPKVEETIEEPTVSKRKPALSKLKRSQSDESKSTEGASGSSKSSKASAAKLKEPVKKKSKKGDVDEGVANTVACARKPSRPVLNKLKMIRVDSKASFDVLSPTATEPPKITVTKAEEEKVPAKSKQAIVRIQKMVSNTDEEPQEKPQENGAEVASTSTKIVPKNKRSQSASSGTSTTTLTDRMTRSRSKSPKFFVSANFLMKHNGQEDQEAPKRASRKRAPSKDSKGVHISTGFLKKTQPTAEAPPTRALRSRQKANEPKEANEAQTSTKTTTHKIPQLDGADDSIQLPKAGKKSNRLQLHKLQKSRSQDSDEDFEPSPPKKPKKAPVIKDRRVLSTDDEGAGGDKSKRKPTAADIWCEVWCDVEQQWMCVDLFKGTVNSEDSIRKSASSSTGFVYCYAFQNDLSVKDVTARYCPHWTTVHKQTVDRTWLETAISDYYGTFTERDRLENQQLRRMHEQKPLPTTISDFKDHPLYALKRHLLKFQAIYPPDAPTCGFIRGEEIYPRDCVYTLHSREIWLKSARTVKLGEQPYKIVKARPKWDRITQTVIKDMPLEIFGYWQTQDYEPPTAENGIVPRNAYGNVELFKECMLPKKTVHLRLPGLQRVCKKLGIDCANAVIGFDFHQGACHPLLDGFVVCEEFAETVTEAWHEDQANQDRKEQEKYEARVYGNWKKLIRGLLIRERLKKKYNF